MATGGFSSYQPSYKNIKMQVKLMIYVYRLFCKHVVFVLLTKRVEHFTPAIKEIINVDRSYKRV